MLVTTQQQQQPRSQFITKQAEMADAVTEKILLPFLEQGIGATVVIWLEAGPNASSVWDCTYKVDLAVLSAKFGFQLSGIRTQFSSYETLLLRQKEIREFFDPARVGMPCQTMCILHIVPLGKVVFLSSYDMFKVATDAMNKLSGLSQKDATDNTRPFYKVVGRHNTREEDNALCLTLDYLREFPNLIRAEMTY